MEQEIGIEDARKNLGKIVDHAEHAGETTYITRRGRRSAAITPVPEAPAMTDTATRQANVSDLPGWTNADTVMSLSGKPGVVAWLKLIHSETVKPLRALGRDMAGALYVAADAAVTTETPYHLFAEAGQLALLAGTEDGIGLWVPQAAYHLIARVDPNEPSGQPDVPAWIPIAEVLRELPAGVLPNYQPPQP
jgi:prevent-host-death family protein